ncbi:hypothetical protein FHS29_004659 [Saccharothrix tamanrassetensis]|uniref:DUF3558 domain-containing protein n=1 Tax=Saccharothrix tamanrassetensis TaxID=1051531 RepID=A0A841CKJ6_9PSEU|nr:DUF3558 family protein [Saccharothrix tamanrassetensis]MBB5958051.1 hypothetical protein [Saccharothrix tamanrassetensis]
MIRARSWIPLAVGLVAVLSGCTTQVAGSAVPVPNPTSTTTAKPEPTAANLLGDLPSLDPCSLVEPAELARFGTPALATPLSLDFCALTVTVPSGAKLEVSVGLLDQLAAEREITGRVEDYRGLRIAEETDDGSRCARRLVFPELVTMTVAVDNFTSDKATPTEMCGIADRAVRAVADRVLAKEVEHRTFPKNSLGKTDPCTSVTSATVGRVPGLAGARVKPYPAAHQCRWSKDGTANPPRVRVTYSVGVPTAADGGNATTEDIAGRPSTVSKSGSASLVLCAAETAHIPFDGGEGVRELAIVTVSLPNGSQVDQACAAARAVAADVWSRLPK